MNLGCILGRVTCAACAASADQQPDTQQMQQRWSTVLERLLASLQLTLRLLPMCCETCRCVGQPSVHEERQRVGARSMAEHQEIVGQVARQQRSEEHSIKIKDRQRKFEGGLNGTGFDTGDVEGVL